jgi:hypothetical protein
MILVRQWTIPSMLVLSSPSPLLKHFGESIDNYATVNFFCGFSFRLTVRSLIQKFQVMVY